MISEKTYGIDFVPSSIGLDPSFTLSICLKKGKKHDTYYKYYEADKMSCWSVTSRFLRGTSFCSSLPCFFAKRKLGEMGITWFL
mmetsp:Transcript_21678/g.34885  ORF Transcript_21678/g.34885 Transcript_21678/m.34885 type:complete len:84 (-) Transcript_21678:48-299(-)